MTPRFVWHDLMTDDPEASAAFYAALLGWEVRRAPEGGYPVFISGGKAVAGLLELGEGGAPHWLGHALVDDVDQTCRRIAFLQGEVLVEPEDVPGIGRTAIVADPIGAVFAPFSRESGADEPADGPLGWSALVAPRPDLAAKVFKTLFGWKPGKSVATPLGPYSLFKLRRDVVAGMLDLPEEFGVPPQWVHHARVPDADAALDRASALGARALHSPVKLPGVGQVAAFLDPRGAAFGVWSAP